jgi:hypothetical protein
MKTITSKLNMTSRISRILIGSVMVGIIMSTNGPVGYLTLLPLLAIYPLMTGLLGEDPINGLFARWNGGFNGHCFKPSTRIALLAIAAGAIGVVMTSPEGVASVAGMIALFSVFLVMAGMFGEDLLTATMLGEGRVKLHTVEEAQPEMSVQSRQGMVHRHDFGPRHGSHDKAA